MDVTSLLTLYVALPLIGVVVSTLFLESRYRRTVDEITKEPNWKEKYGDSIGKFAVFCLLLQPTLIYGILTFFILYMSQPIEDEHLWESLALSGGIIIGFSGLSASISAGIIGYEAMGHIPKDPYVPKPPTPTTSKEYKDWLEEWNETLKKCTFPKYIVLSTISHTIAIYGLLLTILLFTFGGIINGMSSIPSDKADVVVTIGVLYALFSLPAILSGYLPTKVRGDIGEISVFTKKIVSGAIGHTPALLGLIVALILMVQNSLM